jgi:hypothetical protein
MAFPSAIPLGVVTQAAIRAHAEIIPTKTTNRILPISNSSLSWLKDETVKG